MSNESRVVPAELLEKLRSPHRPVRDDACDELLTLLAQPAAPVTTQEPIMLTAVAELVDDGDGGLEPSWILEGGTAELFAGMTLLVADNAPELCQEDGSAEVYTHADASEVERLRAIERSYVLREALLEQVKGERDRMIARTCELSTQLAERDALLRECFKDLLKAGHSKPLRERVKATLSASAEPSAPVDDVNEIEATIDPWQASAKLNGGAQ